MRGSLTVVGTGIRCGNQCTAEAQYFIETADIVFEAVGDKFAQEWVRGLNKNVVSLQQHYGKERTRRQTYAEMAEALLAAVREGRQVCAAFYGHPGVCVFPSHDVIRRAREEGYDATMLPGVSADGCLFADLGVDPGYLGCQSYEATDFILNARRFDPCAALILWQIALAGDCTLRVFESEPRRLALLAHVLMQDYGGDHVVTVYDAATLPVTGPRIQTLRLEDLPSAEVSQQSTLYVPPLRDAAPCPERKTLLAEWGLS